MCGPRQARRPQPTTLMRPSDDLRDAPILEEEPYYSDYQYDPELHKPANGLNEELMIRKKVAKGFDK